MFTKDADSDLFPLVGSRLTALVSLIECCCSITAPSPTLEASVTTRVGSPFCYRARMGAVVIASFNASAAC